MGSVTSIEAGEKGGSGRRHGVARDNLVDELVKQPCQFRGGSGCNCGWHIGVLLQQ